MNPSKHQSSKQRGQPGGWNVPDRLHLLRLVQVTVFTQTPCMNNVISMLYWLVT